MKIELTKYKLSLPVEIQKEKKIQYNDNERGFLPLLPLFLVSRALVKKKKSTPFSDTES